ncbi:MAG: hypothetical protein ABEJ81_09050 [Haloferacaceae archaeon]
MSPDPARLDRSAGALAGVIAPDADRTFAGVVHVLQFVAFWTAAMLPFAYLPLLATGFIERQPVAFGALLLANAVAFRLGHGYRRDARPV